MITEEMYLGSLGGGGGFDKVRLEGKRNDQVSHDLVVFARGT